MSTSKSSTTVKCRFAGCDAIGNRWEFHHGRYCSNKCETRSDGREVLAKFKHDHCRCFSCFRELKTINPPKPDFEFTENGHGWTIDEDGEPTLEYYSQEVTRSAATGFQFQTEHATVGQKSRGERVITGTICLQCGNTDHTAHIPTLADRAAIDRLVDLLAGEDDVAFDIETLHREYEDTRDLDLAVGRALHD